MSEADAELDPLEVLAAEFMERKRRGESPSIADYAARHPELAAEIEEIFPAIAVMEQLKAQKEQASGARVSLGGVCLERLGDFRILGEIGRGGMGIVYEAFQESLCRHVAVKVLPRQALLDAQQLRRFRREAQTAARLHHTNIVPVFGSGEHDGFHYIVMQLIEGAGLDAVLARLRQGDGPAPMTAATPRTAVAGDQASKERPKNNFPISEGDSPIFGERKLGQSPTCFSTGPKPEPIPKTPSALPRGRDGTEVARIAKALAQGRFSQPRGFDALSTEDAQPAGQAPPARAAGQLPPEGMATEEFTFDRDTKVDGGGQAIDASSADRPAGGQAAAYGPKHWRSVAAIGQQVAEALHYAHCHHTLHRDIKPANVLLDAQGAAWITDFGLAKAMEHDHVTQTGGVVGTLRYMAPEQFSGRADARSDIYSLGLTLYELLTLRPAFEDNSRSGLVAKIASGEPPRPRRLNPAIPRDLETIVLKAMAREPRDRYATAGELARDLECFLEDRPIQARRASAAERLWRWARRNHALAGLAACTLLLLVAVAVVASVGYLRTARASALEKIQRKKAEETSALAVEALDSIFRQFAPDRTAPVSASLRVSDADDPITVPVQPVLSKEAAALLEHMLKFYDRLADEGGDDGRLRRKVAEANRRVGDIRQRLGQYAESETAYVRAIELYVRLAEASPHDADLRSEIARIQNELGNVYDAMDRREAGRQSHREALAILEAAVAAPGASPNCRYELARTYYFLGKRPGLAAGPPPPRPDGPRPQRGEPPAFVFDPRGPRSNPLAPFPLMLDEENEGRLNTALALWRELADDDSPWLSPGRDGRRHGPSAVEHNRPPRLSDGSRQADEEYRRKAVDLLERLVADFPTAPDYRHLLARCYREAPPARGDRGATSWSDHLDKATRILEKLVEEYPDVADYRYDLSETYALRGGRPPDEQESASADDLAQSSAMLEKALALSEQLVAEHPNIPEYAVSLVNIRLRLNPELRQSDPARAEANLRKALEVQGSLARRFPDSTAYKFWLAVIEESLGELLRSHGRLADARSALQDCIASFQGVLRMDPQAGHVRGILAKNYADLAEVLRGMGEEQEAEKAMRQAQDVEKPDGSDIGKTGNVD